MIIIIIRTSCVAAVHWPAARGSSEAAAAAARAAQRLIRPISLSALWISEGLTQA